MISSEHLPYLNRIDPYQSTKSLFVTKKEELILVGPQADCRYPLLRVSCRQQMELDTRTRY